MGPFFLCDSHPTRQSDIISFTLQRFLLIYFSTMGPKLFPAVGRLHLLPQSRAQCMFQKHNSCIPTNKIHCKTNSDAGLYTHLQVYYARQLLRPYAGRHKLFFQECKLGLCRAVLACTSSETECREIAAECVMA